MKKEGGNPYLRMRTRRDESDQNYHTAILVAESLVPAGCSTDEFQELLLPKLEEIPGHRPVARLGTPSKSPLKRPLSVYTPNGSKLEREKEYGLLLVFSDKKVTEIARNEPTVIEEKLSTILKETESSAVKLQEMIVNDELLDQIARSQLKRGTHGIPDQNQTMAQIGVAKQEASASKIANLLGIATPNEQWEWLHLLSFLWARQLAQTHKNLTGGTRHANTDMIFAEDELLFLVGKVGGDIHLQVKAEEYPNSHFSQKITYSIITPKFIIPFVFYPQTSIQPSLRNRSYIHGVVRTLLESTTNIHKAMDTLLESTINTLTHTSSRKRLCFEDPAQPKTLLFFNTVEPTPIEIIDESSLPFKEKESSQLGCA